MKFLLAALLLLPLMAEAQQLPQRWVLREDVRNVTGKIGFSYLGASNATATSYTIPTGARCIAFDNVADRWTCFDYSANRYCGSARPTTTVSETAWEFNADKRRLSTISSTAVPDTLWVQVNASATQVVGHWYACE